MYCPYCGAQYQGSPRYCARCGGALPQGPASPADPVPPQNPSEGSDRGGKRKALVALIGVIAVVAVVAIVVCVMVFGGIWASDGDSDSGTDAAVVASTDSGGEDGSAAATDDAASSALVSATTYYTDEDGEEALYSITTYYADGAVASTWSDEAAGPLGDYYEVYETSSTYDEDGNLVTSTTTLENDLYDSYSQTITYGYAYAYSYAYDSAGRPVLITVTYVYEEDGESETYSIAVSYEGDALSLIELEYVGSDVDYDVAFLADLTVDEAGDIVQVDYSRTIDGETEDIISVLYEYDADGNVTKATYESEGGTSVAYYSMYAVLLQPLAATRRCLDIYLAYGFTDEYDHSTYEYDELGNLVAAQAYDAEGEVAAGYAYECTYTYDDEGRVIECVRTPSEDGASVSYRTVYSYE